LASRASTTEFRVLGPFEVAERGEPLDVGVGKQRALLAVLVLSAGEVVSTDRLIDALWGDRPPASALNSVRVYVSHLRRTLGNGRLLTRGRGYLLTVEPEQVDLGRFERLVAEGREALAAGQAERAADVLQEALALWRGPALVDFASEPFAQGEIARLEELRVAALEERLEADLALAHHGELVPELEALVHTNPLRERLRAQLMLALYRSGRQAEALEAYRQARATLVGELGLEPGRRLQELERAILSQDPRLDPPARVAAQLRRARRRGGLLIAIGAGLLLAAAIAVVVIELTGGGSPGLGSAAENAVALIEADTIVADVPVGNGPTGVAVGEGAVWVTNAQDDSVARIDPRSSTVVDQIPLGSAPSGIAVGAGAVWVASSPEGTVSRLDPQTNTVVDRIAVGVTSTAVAFRGGEVWVTSTDERSVTRIDAASDRVIDTIPTGAVGRGIAIGAGSVWVTDELTGSVVRIDPASGKVVRTVNVGNGPTGIAFGAGSLWVANSLDGTVSRIDPKTNTVTAMVSVGEGPGGIAAASDAVWVSVEFSQSIVRIDPAEDRVVERILVGNRPKGLAVAEDRVWFAVQPSGAGHRGGRLVVAKFPIGSIDPADAGRSLSNVYDGLLGAAQRGGSEGTQIVPNLAASLPVVTAGTTYAFQLRRGVHYSDGTPVRASDFQRAFERLFRTRAGIAGWFLSLVGGDVCERRPRRCDLSRGVVTDDATGTIVLHLRHPDGEFLFNLLGNPAPIPPGTPDRLVRTRPVPSTGPYMIASYVPGRTLKLVRNPYFRVWSKTARPDGFPDEIEFRLRLSTGTAVTERAVTAVERGQVDVALGVPAERLQEVKTRYASQLHLDPLVATHFIFLNTTLPPFDDVRVRRALNYAVDRAAVAKAQGGPEVARPTCQLRPPSVAGYRPYCPYTIDPSPTGEWKAPDLVRARRLVAASGTAGMKVTVWTMPARAPATREVVSALKRLGYRARLKQIKAIDYFPRVLDRKTRVQAAMSGLVGGPGSPPSSFLPLLTCNSIRPTGPQWENPSFFCNRRIDARIRRALRIQATDRDAAVHLWVGIERELVDQAPWVPLYTPRPADFVSKRVRNYQYNPELGILLDQLWVR
jgi:YVTN family beta-propeller protein